jgi:RNA polymerase sigma factor (sigma-70 family)
LSTCLDDIQLSNGLIRDDIGAFDALYAKYHHAVFANIFKLVRQQEAAEDVLQEVFAALWVNRKKIDRDKSVGGWLFVVSYNKALKFLNKAVKDKIVNDTEISAEIADVPDDDEQVEYQFNLINEAIANLPPQKKWIFTLCKLEGLTYEEAARVAGISPQTVKEYVSAASKFVKAYSLRQYAVNAPLSLSVLLTFIHHL